jgi:prophage regulatory protein
MERRDGFMRLDEVLTLIPVCKSVWYAGIKSGRFPAQCDIGSRMAVWKAADIYAYIDSVQPAQKSQ